MYLDAWMREYLQRMLLWYSFFLIFCAVGAVSHRHSIQSDLLTHDMVKKGVKVHKDYIHRVVFAVAIKNLDYIESLVRNISDPSHSDYGNYLSADQLADIITQKYNTNNVVEYLTKHSCVVEKRSLHGEYIVARASIYIWETLLQTTFHEYTHDRIDHNGKIVSKIVVGAESYAIPAELADSVVGVMNVLDLLPPYPVTPILQPIDITPDPSFSSSNQSASANLRGSSNSVHVDMHTSGHLHTHISTQSTVVYDGYVRPALLNTVYNITNNTGSAYTSQALYATNQNTLSLSDLSSFQGSFSLPSQTISNIGGRISDTTCTSSVQQCATPNVAIQYMTALAQQTPTLFYYSDLTWDSFLVEVSSMADPPNVVALTYVSDEWTTSNAVKNAFLQEVSGDGTCLCFMFVC
ncbi:hypothetical protein EON63_17115 [archaeon]|nr:MAG: hypothetical protein EON63_17115 [archaeon]